MEDIRLFSPEDCQKEMVAQAEYAKLRLVCKQYNDIYSLQRPQTLSLFKDCSGESLCSLLKWLQGCKDSLQVLETTCRSPCFEAVLKAVASASSQLRIIDTDAISNNSVQLMAHCKLLTTCALSEPVVSPLDLSSLQVLPCLTKVVLQAGHFVNFHVLEHLTSLHLRWSSVESTHDCPCASKLQTLDLHYSGVELHHGGLSACQGLKSLHCVHSCVLSEQDADMLNSFSPETFQVPDNITTLTSLTKLTMQIPGTEELDVRCLYALKGLRDLSLLSTSLNAAIMCTLMENQTLVQNLTRLQLGLE